MGKVVIWITTILVILIITIRSLGSHQLLADFKKLLKQINAQYLDLFYYTIITFTTVGYGDIVPLSIAAKIMSIVIATTSVICLTVFLSSVLSYKNEALQ